MFLVGGDGDGGLLVVVLVGERGVWICKVMCLLVEVMRALRIPKATSAAL